MQTFTIAMEKRVIFFVVRLVFLSGVLSGQSNYIKDDNCAVGNYFEQIYAAENHLMDGEHEKSLKLYNAAFTSDREENIIFFKDIHNALMLAYQNDDTHYFKRFILHLHDYDVDSSLFQTVGYENLKASKFHPIVKEFFDQKRELDHNAPVCSFFERLHMLDQSIRKACREKYGNGFYHFCGDEIALLDSLILEQLIDYFNENGVPREYEFCNIRRHYFPPYELIITHNQQWCRPEVIDILKDQIGRVHPQVLAFILDYVYNNPCDGSESDDPLGLSYQLRLGDQLYLLEIPVERIEMVNENRKAIHLDQVEDFHRKIIFQEFNPEYVLVNGRFMFHLDADESFINTLKDRFKSGKVTEERLR